MIKIIEEGTRRLNTCPDCGCKYSFEKDDVKSEESKLYPGKYNCYVECPQCHEKNHIWQDVIRFEVGGIKWEEE